MTTLEVATRLIELCSQAKFETAQDELFADDAVSIEPEASAGFDKETKGLQAIKEKGRKWDEMVEQTHELNISVPMVVENAFACVIHMDVTLAGQGRINMKELCVYKLRDGKIISEEFFM